MAFSKAQRWLRARSAALAFLLLGVAGGVAIDLSAHDTAKKDARASALVIYNSQYQSCVSDNALRREINNRVGVVAVQRAVLLSFIRSAETARRANFRETHMRSDKKAANQYGHLAKIVNRKIHYGRVTLVDCATAVKKP